MGWGVGDCGVEDRLREAGGKGDFCGTKAKEANRLGFGHCPENSASDSPLICPRSPPIPSPLNNRGDGASRVRRTDKRGPWARLGGDHTAARLLLPQLYR